jgi:hypothetical protein
LLPQLSLSVRVNQPSFSVGEILIVSVEASNPGLPGAADFFVGVWTDPGAVYFFTDASGGGVWTDQWNYDGPFPIAKGVPLSAPFSVAAPNFLVYEWGDNACGSYLFFLVAMKPGWDPRVLNMIDGLLAFATADATVACQ